MRYIELNIKLKEVFPYSEILIAKLNEINFEGYNECDDGIKAYVQVDLFNQDLVDRVIFDIRKFTEINYHFVELEEYNWNKQWEENFEPVHINKDCVIRASFHKKFSDKEYELIITPKMSFGTGHHETTYLMINEMFNINFKKKNVLDIGSGTGILSILSSLLGANTITGIDIDENAFLNSQENALLNNVNNVAFSKETVDTVSGDYDIILANINRNVILNDIHKYIQCMRKDACLLLSGFFEEDIPLIFDEKIKSFLKLITLKNKNKWQILHLQKK